jgi:DNA recombination protein RmuC
MEAGLDWTTGLLLLLACGLGATIALLIRRSGPRQLSAADLLTAVGEMRQSVETLRGDVQPTLEGVHRTVGQIAEQARHIEDVGRDIASLQNILQPPKLRGALGELMLERLLGQVLPSEAFSSQHRFLDGRTVDAIVRIGERIVPIDSKFPLEAFQRLIAAEDEQSQRLARRQFDTALRGHVDAVAKYILPDEGTLQFALMYIPAENVYYEAIVKQEICDDDLRDYAYQKKVIPVSPHSLYAYLEVIALGLKGLAVETRAQQVVDQLAQLNGELQGFRQDFDTMGRHLTSANGRYAAAAKRLDRFGYQLARAADAPTALGDAIAEPLADADPIPWIGTQTDRIPSSRPGE